MKVKIDQEGCIECGTCEKTCSDVFVVKDGKKASIVKSYQSNGPDEGEVPEHLRDCVEEAIEGCPVGVIDIIKDR